MTDAATPAEGRDLLWTEESEDTSVTEVVGDGTDPGATDVSNDLDAPAIRNDAENDRR